MKIKLFTIPNLLTLSSLLCGSFAAVSALVYHDLELTFWLTVAAGVFDYCDGYGKQQILCHHGRRSPRASSTIATASPPGC